MKRLLSGFFWVLGILVVFGQKDSIYLNARIIENSRQVEVTQEMIHFNTTTKPLNRIKLLNWVAAYQNRDTPLLQRKLEDRKSDLYFSKPDEWGSLENLKIQTEDSATVWLSTSDENIFVPLNQNLKPGEKVKLSLRYTLNLPASKFTGYGKNGKKLNLKYFFLVPDGFETDEQLPKYYLDIEENQSPEIYWKVNLNIPANWHSESNLNEIYPNYFSGKITTDPEFVIAENTFESMSITIDNEKMKVVFGYPLLPQEKRDMEFYLPLQLHFIKNKIGVLPSKILVTEKSKNTENFTGTDDIKFWKLRWELFSDAQKTDLNYFSILSKKLMELSAVFEKNQDHWLLNGLKTYMEIQYIDRYYRQTKLLGELPENAKIFGLKPLKLFHAAKLKLGERYGLTYQYIMTQNLDQKIATPFAALSNFNAVTISHFETGSVLSFIAEKIGTEKFDDFITQYLRKNAAERINTDDFNSQLNLISKGSSAFLSPFIQQKNRTNFSLKPYQKRGNEFQFKVIKNTPLAIPFKIETLNSKDEKKVFWFDTDASEQAQVYRIPQSDAEKIVLNGEYIFPETNFRDNYRYTKGFFANQKKIRFKIFKDIPNPEYNEIYINPRVNFNVYDRVLAGLNFRNSSFFDRKFNYSLTPYYSSGTGKLTGSGALTYSFLPAESFYRSLDFGISGSYFHYDYDLTYRKLTAFVNLNFVKNPRRDVGESIGISYNYFDKDLTPAMVLQNEYGRYNLWSASYGFADRSLIHEKYLSTNLQVMEDFQKISAEAFYRWEFDQHKKISFRFFAGYFLNNKTKNNLFDYGISRTSNYSFSYGLLGQSATTGILAQQMVIVDGGFKSYLGTTANQWITSLNVDSHVWRWFNVYADAGIYKSNSAPAKFIWDSGVKLKVIPDFLEVYFPVQSSLGFEPSFKDYASRIRFTLVLNFSAVTNYFRRGWF